MQLHVEDVGPCKKLLKIEIPSEKVNAELDKTYTQLNDSVVVPGFRAGHVPRWLMESRFGKQVNDDAKQALMAESFDEAIKEKDLRPIGTPKFDEEIEFAAGKPLAFGVTIEIHPQFEIEDYTALELEKPSTEPSKPEIEQRIELIRKRYAKLVDVAEGSPKKDDVVLCHLTLREGEAVYRDVPKHQFIVGDHVLVGMTVDETTAFVTKAKIGETAETKVTLPDQFQDEAKRGKEMTLSLQIEGARRPVLPEVTEEWIKGVGFDSLDEFHAEISSALRRDKDLEAQEKLNEQMDEQLSKKADFELPEDVISSMAERTLIRRSMNLRYQGVSQDQVEKQVETLKAESRETAAKAAKLFFILDKIADKERIFVTEDEVTARVEAIASNYNRPADQVLREMEANDRLTELRATMREEKVRAFLLEKAGSKPGV